MNQPDDDKTRTYMALESGTIVSHYRIIEKVGVGGMSKCGSHERLTGMSCRSGKDAKDCGGLQMDSDVSVGEMIYELEKQLQQRECRQSRAYLEKLLSEQFREFGSTGRVYDRAAMIDALASEGSLTVVMDDFQVQQLAKDIFLATYRATMVTPDHQPPRHSLRSSVWKCEEGQWHMIFHQGTPTSTIA